MTRVNINDRLSVYKLSTYIVRHVSHSKNVEDGLICRFVPQAVNTPFRSGI